MRRAAAIALGLTVSLSAICHASPNYVSSFVPGTYTGHVVSVHPGINDTEATMELSRRGDDLVAEVKLADGSEEWVWNARHLSQTEYDTKGKELRKYTATAHSPGSANGQIFEVDCSSKGSCTEQIDSRHSWRLETDGEGITYSVYGVSMDEWGDKAATAHKRHVLRFSRVESGIAKNTKQ